jgi:hypothetical protein
VVREGVDVLRRIYVVCENGERKVVEVTRVRLRRKIYSGGKASTQPRLPCESSSSDLWMSFYPSPIYKHLLSSPVLIISDDHSRQRSLHGQLSNRASIQTTRTRSNGRHGIHQHLSRRTRPPLPARQIAARAIPQERESKIHCSEMSVSLF